MVEDVSHVAVGNEPVKRINQKVSVCYHGAFSSYHSNGVLATIGHYEHGYYKGEWRKYDENGKLLEKIRYKAHE
jgi:antitoxin component YwqK of YwqJK toxin-antitoxin module